MPGPCHSGQQPPPTLDDAKLHPAHPYGHRQPCQPCYFSSASLAGLRRSLLRGLSSAGFLLECSSTWALL